MKRLILFVTVASLVLAAPPREKGPTHLTPVVTTAPTFASVPQSRVVQVGDRDVIAVSTRLRFTTMIVLPKGEEILDFVCGDKEFWVVNGSQNMAFVKPAKEAGQTNLNLIAASGNVYSFTLIESGEAQPDLKIFVEPKGEGLLASLKATPRFVPTQSLDDYRAQVEIARADAAKARDEAAQQIADVEKRKRTEVAMAKAAFPAAMKFDYEYSSQDVFAVSAIYHDDKFTYIRANPQETPALYELKDGKASLIQFQYADGLYTIPKILDRGYLAIGKKKMHFTREK